MIDSKKISVGDHLEVTKDFSTLASNFKKGEVLIVIDVNKNIDMISGYNHDNATDTGMFSFTRYDYYKVMTSKNQYVNLIGSARIFSNLKLIEIEKEENTP